MFQNYITKIKNEKIRNATELAKNNLPEYFWTKPASSSKKYHMKITNVKGGLAIHTQICADILLEFYNIVPLTDLEKDIGLSAIILHDGKKYGEGGDWTKSNHDDLAGDWLNELWTEDFEGRNEIINAIRSHNGVWSTTVKPKTKIEKLVHFADYLGSRSFWESYFIKESELK
jgi:hypothetical protein